MIGDSTRFAHQDANRGGVAGHAAAARHPARRPSLRAGVIGPGGAKRWSPATAAARTLGRRHEHGRTNRTAASRAQPRLRRSRRSPTTRSSPTATRARSWPRRIDRMALRPVVRLPRACSAACLTARRNVSGSGRSGSITRRARLRAGHERLCDDLEDAVRLDRRARRADDRPVRITRTRSPAHAAPADDDADAHARCGTVECFEGSVEVELICEPAFDYGRTSAQWDARRRRPARGRCPTAPGQTIRLAHRPAHGHRGQPRARASRAGARRPGVLRALTGPRTSPGPRRRRRTGSRHAATVASGVPGSAARGSRTIAAAIRSSARRSRSRASPYMPTGAAVAASHHVASRRPPGGERNWDYRYTWMRDATFTLQALHWLEPRLGSRRVHAVRRRRGGHRGRLAADHVRHRRAARPHRDDARRPLRVCRRAPGTDRQRRVRPAPERCLRRGARTRSCCTRTSERVPRRPWPIVESQAECAAEVWREPDQGIWEARGKPQHYVSSKLMCWVALDRAAKLAEIRGAPDKQARWQAIGGRDPEPTSSQHGVSDRGSAHAALRDRLARRLDAPGGDFGFPAAR